MGAGSTNDVYLPGRRLRTAAGIRARGWVIYGIYLASYFWWIRYVQDDLRLLASLAFIFLPVIYAQIPKRIIASYNRAATFAVGTLHQGNAVRAERELESLQAQFRWPRFLGRLTGYNRALAVMRQGRLADAIAILADVDRRGGAIGIDGAIASTLAYLHALRGEVELAETWQLEARRRDVGMIHATRFPYIMSEIAIELREGKFRAVQTQLDRNWAEMEETLKGDRLRPLRLFRAFAATQASDVRDAGAITPLLAGLQGAHAEEFAYLATAWPELDAFVRTHLPA